MFDVRTLKNCFRWGWCDEAYLDALISLGKLSKAEKDVITGKNVIHLDKEKTADTSGV